MVGSENENVWVQYGDAIIGTSIDTDTTTGEPTTTATSNIYQGSPVRFSKVEYQNDGSISSRNSILCIGGWGDN